VGLSRLGTFNDMGDDDPETTFGHIAYRRDRWSAAVVGANPRSQFHEALLTSQ
jgi:hypothetical protein